jgi:hypothetical protein
MEVRKAYDEKPTTGPCIMLVGSTFLLILAPTVDTHCAQSTIRMLSASAGSVA